MSYEERGQWVYLAVTTIAYGAYLVLMTGRANTTPLPEIEYQPIMLWTIGAAIAGSIIIRIAIEIVRPSESQREDVRDKEIGRFGEYVSGVILGVGMVGPLILTLIEADHFWIGNAIYLVFVVQAVAGTVIKLVAYRRGF